MEVPCVHDACSKLVKKSELADHLENECRVRLQECQRCGELVTLCEMKVLYTIDRDKPHTLKRTVVASRILWHIISEKDR